MNTNEQHAVFASVNDEIVRVSPWRDWHGAIARWHLLDDTRITVNARKDGWTNVQWFAVRSADDPQFNKAPYAPSRILATVGKGSSEDTPVLKRIGKTLGLVGYQGGWIYRDGQSKPVTQGWSCFYDEWVKAGRLIVRVFSRPGAHGAQVDRRYFQNAFDLDVAS